MCKTARISEVLQTQDSWHIVTRFCFKKDSTGKPQCQYSLTNTVAPYLNNIFLFPTSFEYEDILEEPLTCKEKVDRAAGYTNHNKLVYDQISIPVNEGEKECYFITIGNCDVENNGSMSQRDIDTEYLFLLRNGKNEWDYELSYDERGMLIFSILFFLIEIFLTFGSFMISNNLRRIEKYHPTVKILNYSIYIQDCSCLFLLLYYLFYSDSGKIFPLLRLFSSLFYTMSESLIILLFILIGKGWTIIRRKISRNGRVRISVYYSIYLGISMVSILYREIMNKPYNNNIFYYTLPGYFLMVLKFVVIIWYIYSIFTTFRQSPRKHHFYYKFISLCMLYFLLNIIFVLSIDKSSEMNRFLYYYISHFVLLFSIQFVMLLLYNPNTHCNSSFPFHQRLHETCDTNINSSIGKANIITDLTKELNRQFTLLKDISKDMNKSLGATLIAIQKSMIISDNMENLMTVSNNRISEDENDNSTQ